MSDETSSSPETPTNPPAEAAPRARRISNPRPKKAAKSAAPKESAPQAAPPEEAPKSAAYPDFSESNDSQENQAPRNDWPEPEAPSSGDASRENNPKRKRRRKKGKGGNSQNQPAAADLEITGGDISEPASAQSAPPGQQPRQHQPAPRPKLDPELLAKFAWKIYLSEVSEEGVALIGDNDAKELSRRCFRLAEIFMEEQSRRR